MAHPFMLVEVLEKLVAAKQSIAQLEDDRRALEETAIQMIEALGESGISWDYNGKPARASVIRSGTIKFDEQGLEQGLGPEIWESITKRVLDQKKLEDGVARGSIDIETVTQYSFEAPKKPYIKVTFPK